MKKLLLGALLLLSTLSFSQSKNVDKMSKDEMLSEMNGNYNLDENNNVTITQTIDIPNVTKDELYVKVLTYFTYNYKDGESVIQVQDKENGLIIGKGIYKNSHVGVDLLLKEISTWHIIRVDIKDNKIRVIVTLTQYDLKMSGGSTLPTYYSYTIGSTFPINSKGSMEKLFTKSLYKSIILAKNSIKSIEKSLIDGNTSKLETKEW